MFRKWQSLGRRLLLYPALGLGMASCLKVFNSESRGEHSTISANESHEQSKSRLEDSLITELQSWFHDRHGKRLDPLVLEKKLEKLLPIAAINDRERVLEAVLNHSLNRIGQVEKERRDTHQESFVAESLFRAVQKSMMIDYLAVFNKDKHKFEFTNTSISKIPGRYALLPHEVLPFLTRYVTKRIRSQRSGQLPDQVSGMIGAVPLKPGALRDTVFQGIQSQYPSIALSSRINDVFIVTEFHRRTLQTVFLDRQQHVNSLLAIDNIGTQLPELRRIVGSYALIENMISNLDAEGGTKGLKAIALVFTDSFDESTAKKLRLMVSRYPRFFRHVSGLGFIGDPVSLQKPPLFFSEEMKTLLTPTAQWAPKEIEVDPILLDETDIPGLLHARVKVILHSKRAEQTLHNVLRELHDWVRGGVLAIACQQKLGTLDQEASILHAEGTYLLSSGVPTSFTEASRSALMVASP